VSWITWQNRQADLHLEPQAETLVLSQLVWDIERFLAHLQHLDAGPFEAGSEASARPMPTSVRALARQLWHTGLGSVTQRQAVGEQVGGLPAKNVHPLEQLRRDREELLAHLGQRRIAPVELWADRLDPCEHLHTEVQLDDTYTSHGEVRSYEAGIRAKLAEWKELFSDADHPDAFEEFEAVIRNECLPPMRELRHRMTEVGPAWTGTWAGLHLITSCTQASFGAWYYFGYLNQVRWVKYAQRATQRQDLCQLRVAQTVLLPHVQRCLKFLDAFLPGDGAVPELRPTSLGGQHMPDHQDIAALLERQLRDGVAIEAPTLVGVAEELERVRALHRQWVEDEARAPRR
jgi:hypothetical protein